MMRVKLKLVPDALPDADGYWIEADIPFLVPVFDLVPVEGHHVVAISKAQDPQDGGPMHANMLYNKPAPYRFDMSWLKTDT